MPVLNPLAILKSLVAFDRPWSHLRPWIKALCVRPYKLAALEALRNELMWKHTEMPESVIWRISRLAEKARAAPGDAAATPLIEEIWRGALWELQTRNRAT